MSPDHTPHTSPDAPDGNSTVHVLRLQRPQQLLAAIPQMLGFQPHDSLVAVMLRGTKVVLTARVDFPSATAVAHVWPAFQAAITRSRPDAALLIAYTSPAGDPVMLRIMATAPLTIIDAIRIQDGRYWVLTCPDPTCCPPGQPIEPQPDVAAPFVAVEGRAVAADRASLAACLTPAPEPVLAQVTDRLQTLFPRPTDPSAALAELDRARRSRVDGPVQPTPDEAARLLHALADVDVRDASLGWYDGDDAWWLWLDLIPFAPPAQVPVVATLIAVTAYLRGDGAMSTIAAQHALTHDPDYQLAQLLLRSARAAIPPTAIAPVLRKAAVAARERTRRRTTGDTGR